MKLAVAKVTLWVVRGTRVASVMLLVLPWLFFELEEPALALALASGLAHAAIWEALHGVAWEVEQPEEHPATLMAACYSPAATLARHLPL